MNYESLCKFELSSVDKTGVINELLSLFELEKNQQKMLFDAIELRERLGTTAMGGGISLPHTRSILVDGLKIVVGKSEKGISWDDEKISVVVLFISPVKPGGPEKHNEFLGHISQNIKEHSSEILVAASEEELLSLLGLLQLEQGE